MLGVGEELADDLVQPGEVVGDEQEDVVEPAVDEILEDLGPERLGFPTVPHPDPQDLFCAVEVDSDRNEQDNVAHLSIIGTELGPVAVDEHSEPIGWEGLGLVEMELVANEGLGIVEGVGREWETECLKGALELGVGVVVGDYGDE